MSITPTLADLAGDDQHLFDIGRYSKIGQVPPPPPPTATDLRPESAAVVDDPRAHVAPSVVPTALPMSRFALTKQQTAPTGPGINAAPPPAPGYIASSVDPNTGQPTALNPSLTKLGKLLTVLQAAGKGAAVGSTQPTFGTGLLAEQQNINQQTDQFQKQQQAAVGLQQARANMGMVNTPWGAMPMSLYRTILPKVLPAQIAGETRENVADTQAGAKKDVAATQALSREKVAGINAQAKRDTVAGVPLTADDIKNYHLPPQFLGTRAKITDIAAAERAGVFKDIPMMTDKGLVVVNRETGKVRQATDDEGQKYATQALAGMQEVPDPDNPGHTKFVQKGKLESGGYEGTGSVALQVARQAAKAEVPTKYADQVVAFKTMAQHADLLRQAVKALGNGDNQTLAGLENAFKTEFGYEGPVTAAAIADAYKGEVSNVINKGHITDTGSEKVAHTLDPLKQNYQQMDSVLSAYQALAQSKMNMLNQQMEDAKEHARKPGGKNAPPAPDKKHPVGLVPF